MNHLLKASEQHFPAVLYMMLYKVVLIFESVNGSVTIQMNATKQYTFLWQCLLSITRCFLLLSLLMKS